MVGFTISDRHVMSLSLCWHTIPASLYCGRYHDSLEFLLIGDNSYIKIYRLVQELCLHKLSECCHDEFQVVDVSCHILKNCYDNCFVFFLKDKTNLRSVWHESMAFSKLVCDGVRVYKNLLHWHLGRVPGPCILSHYYSFLGENLSCSISITITSKI